MSFTKYIVLCYLATFCLKSHATTTCNFDFMIPGSGPTCEMKGGLASDLIDKYEELFGGVEGLKLVVDDKNGLRKMTQDAFSKIQREQQIYSQNIKQIANEIQAVKSLLGILPIEPPENEQDDSKDQIVRRAVDPYSALRAALQDAEIKLKNMTRNMIEAARRQSMAYSATEQRIQQQDIRLQSTLMRIGVLEKRAGSLPGTSQSQAGGISSSTFDAIMNIATISAKIQATSEIVQARVKDLNERLQEMDKPIQEREKKYQALKANTNRLSTGISKLSADVKPISMDFNKYKNKLTQDLASEDSDIKQAKQKYNKLITDTAGFNIKIKKDEAMVEDNKKTLKLADAELTQLKKNLTSIDPDIKNITSSITLIKKDPLVDLAKVLSTESAASLKFTKDVGQTSKMANSIDAMMKMLDKRISMISASG